MGPRPAVAILVLLFVSVWAACIGQVPPDPLSPVDAPSVDLAQPLVGVPDRGDDPAVVRLDVRGAGACAGALLAADVVLTARRCAPPSPGAVRVFLGGQTSTAVERARSLRVLWPPRGGPDVAVLLLDASIDDVAPLAVRATGAARGGHVRTAGFTEGVRVVRDHVPVVGANDRAFDVVEAACAVVAGGAALDETSGAIVGVLTSGAPSCVPQSDRDVYARADAASPLVAEALALGRAVPRSRGATKTRKGPIDMGAACARGADCAAGACVTYAGAQYCSRTCGPHDLCPTHFKCMQAVEGGMACVLR